VSTGRTRVLPLLPGAVAAGVVTALGFPPFGLGPVSFVGVALLVWLVRSAQRGAVGALLAFVYAVAFFAVLLAWLLRLGVLPYAALVTTQALFWLPVGWVAAHASTLPPAASTAVTAGTWTLAEWVRARAPLGGFEWGQLGFAFGDLPLRAGAAVVGALGLTLLGVAAAAALVAGLAGQPRRRGVWLPAATVLALAGAVVALGQRHWTAPAGELQLAVVQVDPVCAGPAVNCAGEDDKLLDRFVARTRALPTGLDLVVWGEAALGAVDPRAAGAALRARLPALQAPLLAGVTSPAGPGRFFNRNVLFAPTGDVVAAYAKRHPVPFGEYVPARRFLSGLGDVGRLVPADLVRGRRPGRLVVGGLTLGTVSSFELSFARDVRAAARDASGVVTLTSESTYGRAAVSDQLLQIAQVRAAEFQKPVVVAATTGRSTVVSSTGQRGPVTDLYAGDVLLDTLSARTGATPYERAGDVPVVVVALVLSASGLAARRFGQSSSRAGRPGPTRTPGRWGDGNGDGSARNRVSVNSSMNAPCASSRSGTPSACPSSPCPPSP
jgi:apolipoprotein N-acyltransferase